MDAEKAEKKRMMILALIFFIIITTFGIRYWLEMKPGPQNLECKVMYGEGSCIDGSLAIPFFNPNEHTITRMRITVPFGVDTDITLPADFNINEPLASGKLDVLKLVNCDSDIDISGFSMEWCCSESCYTDNMNNISSDVIISR